MVPHIEVLASRDVIILLGIRIRVQTPEFDGYGEVVAVENVGDREFATVACHEEYHG
jgi:hypothetical protein